MSATNVFVTNFNRNFTGVSATTAAVLRIQQQNSRVRLVGEPLPGCDAPISRRQAVRETRDAPFPIWHVRRNSEMQTALWARDVLGLPIKIVFTSAAQRRHSAWPRWLISRMDAIIATTDEAAQFVGNVWSVVPHGVDTTVFSPPSDKSISWAQTGLPGQRGIACVGRIRPEKGTDLFVETMIKTLPNFPGTTGVIIGKAKASHQKFQSDLQARIARAGLRDRFVWLGEIPAPDLPSYIAAMDMLVALPRYEGFGMTPLEAMSCQVPIVASDAGHFSAFLGQDYQKFIVEQGNPETVAKLVSTLLQDANLRHEYGVQLRQRAVEYFDVRAEAAAIQKVYDRLWAGEN